MMVLNRFKRGRNVSRKKTFQILSLLVAMGLSACSSGHHDVNDPYPHELPRFAGGAGVGAVSGATAAGLWGTHSSAGLGAVAGAFIGAPIGSYYDLQGAMASLRKQGVTVVELGDIFELVIPADRLFLGGDSEIKRDVEPLLDQIVSLLLQYGHVNVSVAGYSDNVGSNFEKIARSQHQAQSVATYLWSRGINLQRMRVVGYGDHRSSATYRTAAGNALNRRIEITLWRKERAMPLKLISRGDDPAACWIENDPEDCVS